MFKKIALLLSILGLSAGVAIAGNPETPAITQTLTQYYTKNKTAQSFVVRRVSIGRNFALASWVWGEAGGQAVLKKDGKWVVISAGGGRVDEKTLLSLGVPQEIAHQMILIDRRTPK
jgi:hypothetical protein